SNRTNSAPSVATMMKFGRMKAQPPAHAPQNPPRMYEIQIPTWIARGPGSDLQTAIPSRISSFVSHFFSPTTFLSICPTKATGPPKPRSPYRHSYPTQHQHTILPFHT